jgi:peptidyl-prolyl cis-trans isomerase C
MVRTDRFAGFVLSAALVLAACDGGAGSGAQAPSGELSMTSAPTLPDPAVIGDTLGTVNGLPIGSKEFDALATRKGRDVELDEAARAEVMDRLVAEKLLYHEALRQGIDKDPKIQKMMVNTLLKQDVYSSVKTSDITEDALRAYFEEHKEDFVVPEKAQVKRILIAPSGEDEAAWTAAKAKAESVRGEVLERKAEFRKLAQDHSAGAYARRGGDLGFVTRDGKPGIPPEVIDVAFTLDKGGVSDVFRSKEGWNIVYVPNKRDRVERTFDQMRGSVLRKVKSDTYTALYDGYVGKLKGGATISIDEKAVAAHEVSVPTRPSLSAPGDEPDAIDPSDEAPDEPAGDE